MALTFAPVASGVGSHSAATNAATGYTKTVLVHGAPIHGSNGLAIAGRRLLVASALGGELVALDRRTGHIVKRLSHSSGVDSPDDVAVGPDGSIYWTDIQIGEVGRLAPNGKVTKQKVALGMNPIAFSASGRLFVAQAFVGDGLYELDPALVKPPRVVIPDSGPAGAPWPRQLNGFDFGPDGMLYAPQPFLGRIVRINPDTGKTTVVADKLPGGQPPSSVEFDSHGHLYVSLYFGTVARVNRATGATHVVAQIPGATLDNMVFGARGRLYVSSDSNGAVYVVRRDGTVHTLSPAGSLILPGGIALVHHKSGHDSLFVSNMYTLPEFDARSGRLLSAALQTRQPGGIIGSLTVAPYAGNLVLTSWLSNQVQIWDPVAGKEVKLFNDFKVPMNAIGFRGDLVVAQLGTGSLVRQNAAGQRTEIATGLKVPAGLAATRNALWVSDQATGEVWQVIAHGTVLAHPRLVAKGLAAPEGLAMDRNGSLLVVEVGKRRLSRIDLATGHVTTVAGGLAVGLKGSSGAPPTYVMSSVTVQRNGTILVTGDLADVVYRLRPVHTS
ncbi:MAG: hypothetical protein ACXVW6_01150 [Nocardioidaceae bacterium]